MNRTLTAIFGQYPPQTGWLVTQDGDGPRISKRGYRGDTSLGGRVDTSPLALGEKTSGRELGATEVERQRRRPGM